MEQDFINELQELSNLETAGETLDDTQQSRLSVLKALDEAEKTADKKSKDLESALAQKEHFRTKFEESQKITKKEETKTELQQGLSTLDIISLTKADINEEDIPEVLEYAKFKKITVQEALKSGVIKSLLAEKIEQRNTADATNVKTARKAVSKVSGEELLDKAKKGEMPDDPSDIIKAQIAKAKEANKRN